MSPDLADSAPTVARALVRQLKRLGVRRIYGRPGEDHHRVLDAIEVDRLTVVSALEVVAATLPDDTLVAVDAGFAKPTTAYLWRPGAPGAYFASHGLSTMGYADVSTLDELRCALAEAQHSRVPTLIGAHIDTSRHADWYGLIRG